MFVGLFGGLLIVACMGAPATSMFDASSTGLTTSVVDEQAVEVAAVRMVRRRSAIRSLRRRVLATRAVLSIQTSRLRSLLTHRWPPDRQLPPPSWRGPPLRAL